MGQPYPDENSWWNIFRDQVKIRYEAAGRTFPPDFDFDLFKWWARTAYDIGNGLPKDDSAAKHLHELEDALGLDLYPTAPNPPTPSPTPSPINPIDPSQSIESIRGFLRTTPQNSFSDDSGPRKIQFCSWFPALRVFRDDRDEALRQLDRIVGRWHGPRIFWHLATQPFWSGNEVLPSWHNFDSLLRDFLDECFQRGLRVSLTAGDLQLLGDHEANFRRVASICRDTHPQVVALSSMVNEARVNSTQKEDWDYWANLSHIWQSIYPWGQHGLSDPDHNEEPQGLLDSSRSPASVILLHGTRSPADKSIWRAFNVRYEADLPKPIVQDEPTGPGDRVYQRQDDPDWIWGLYTTHLITGQLPTYFASAALTSRLSLESDWGFKELPLLWKNIPEDVGTFTLTPGHKSSAPLSVRSFADRGEGPVRFDQSHSSNRCFGLIYGGRGRWTPFSRWNASFLIHSSSGVIQSGTVREGEDLPVNLFSNDKIKLIELIRL